MLGSVICAPFEGADTEGEPTAGMVGEWEY